MWCAEQLSSRRHTPTAIGHLTIKISQPFTENGSEHLHLVVGSVHYGYPSPSEAVRVPAFPDDEGNLFVAPVHVDAQQDGKSLLAVLATFASLSF